MFSLESRFYYYFTSVFCKADGKDTVCHIQAAP